MINIDNIKNDHAAAKKTIESLQNNQINGIDLGDYIFNKVINRIDPISYIENVLRAHLPESKRHLHENQVELVRAVCNPKIRKVGALMARQAGKCFAKNTKILMADMSTKNVQDIQVNDKVMGADSLPRLVTSLGQGIETLYKIIPSDGYAPFTVNESHILSLIDTDTRQITNISVHDYLQLPDDDKKRLHGYRAILDFPYHVSEDTDFYSIGYILHTDSLKDCMTNSIDVRKQVFAGVIDSYLTSYNNDKHDGIILSVLYLGAAQTILLLARSLGFAATYYNSLDNGMFNINIIGNFRNIPVKVNKAINSIGMYCDSPMYFDFEILQDKVDKYFGFTLEETEQQNHLFLLDDLTVVHNTESIASFTGYLLDNYPNMRIGIFTPRVQQAEVNVGRTSIFFQMNEEKLNNKLVKCTKQKIELSNNSYVMAVSGSDQSNIEGLTFDVIILDEAQKITNYTWSERISP